MNIGDRMKALRKQKHMSADDLAKKIGVSRSTVFRYEKGDIEKVPIEIVAKVADALGVKPGQLMGLKPTSIADEVHNIVSQLQPSGQKKVYDFAANQLAEQNHNRTNVVSLPNERVEEEIRPIVTNRSTAAGDPINGEDQDVGAVTHLLKVDDLPEGTDEVVTVDGDSMEPDYKKGSQIYIHWQPVVESGELAVVHVEDEGVTFKQVFIDYDRHEITLHSLNSAYEDRIFCNNEISIIGKVLN